MYVIKYNTFEKAIKTVLILNKLQPQNGSFFLLNEANLVFNGGGFFVSIVLRELTNYRTNFRNYNLRRL